MSNNNQYVNYSRIAGTDVPENPARLQGQVGIYLMIASIFFPPLLLAGYIVCILALRTSKKYGFENPTAKLGIIIGSALLICVFVALWVIFMTITGGLLISL